MAQQQEYGLQTTEANRKHTVLWAFMAAIPLLALLGMEMATLKIASDYGFHPMLGQPWFSVLGVPVYAPWRVFTWEGISQPVMDNALVLGQAFFLLPLFLAAAEHSAKPQAKMPKGMVTPRFKPIFEDILREGQLAGEIRDDVSAELIAEMFHSIYQAAAFSKLSIGFQENVALKTRLLLAGIRKA